MTSVGLSRLVSNVVTVADVVAGRHQWRQRCRRQIIGASRQAVDATRGDSRKSPTAATDNPWETTRPRLGNSVGPLKPVFRESLGITTIMRPSPRRMHNVEHPRMSYPSPLTSRVAPSASYDVQPAFQGAHTTRLPPASTGHVVLCGLGVHTAFLRDGSIWRVNQPRF